MAPAGGYSRGRFTGRSMVILLICSIFSLHREDNVYIHVAMTVSVTYAILLRIATEALELFPSSRPFSRRYKTPAFHNSFISCSLLFSSIPIQTRAFNPFKWIQNKASGNARGGDTAAGVSDSASSSSPLSSKDESLKDIGKNMEDRPKERKEHKGEDEQKEELQKIIGNIPVSMHTLEDLDDNVAAMTDDASRVAQSPEDVISAVFDEHSSDSRGINIDTLVNSSSGGDSVGDTAADSEGGSTPSERRKTDVEHALSAAALSLLSTSLQPFTKQQALEFITDFYTVAAANSSNEADNIGAASSHFISTKEADRLQKYCKAVPYCLSVSLAYMHRRQLTFSSYHNRLESVSPPPPNSLWESVLADHELPEEYAEEYGRSVQIGGVLRGEGDEKRGGKYEGGEEEKEEEDGGSMTTLQRHARVGERDAKHSYHETHLIDISNTRDSAYPSASTGSGRTATTTRTTATTVEEKVVGTERESIEHLSAKEEKWLLQKQQEGQEEGRDRGASSSSSMNHTLIARKRERERDGERGGDTRRTSRSYKTTTTTSELLSALPVLHAPLTLALGEVLQRSPVAVEALRVAGFFDLARISEVLLLDAIDDAQFFAFPLTKDIRNGNYSTEFFGKDILIALEFGGARPNQSPRYWLDDRSRLLRLREAISLLSQYYLVAPLFINRPATNTTTASSSRSNGSGIHGRSGSRGVRGNADRVQSGYFAVSPGLQSWVHSMASYEPVLQAAGVYDPQMVPPTLVAVSMVSDRKWSDLYNVLSHAMRAIFQNMADCSEIWDEEEIIRLNRPILQHTRSIFRHFVKECGGESCELNTLIPAAPPLSPSSREQVEERVAIGAEQDKLDTFQQQQKEGSTESPIELSSFERARIEYRRNHTINAYFADLHNDCGNLFLVLGEWQASTFHYETALHARERLLGTKHVAVAASLSGLGTALGHIGRYNTSARYFRHALHIYDAILQEKVANGERVGAADNNEEDEGGIAPMLHAMGSLYFRLHDHSTALVYLLHALDQHRSPSTIPGNTEQDSRLASLSNISSTPPAAATLAKIGDTYCRQRQFEKARQYHDRAVEIFREMDRTNSVKFSRRVSSIGFGYFDQRNYQDSLHFFKQAVQALRSDVYSTTATSNNPATNLSKFPVKDLELATAWFMVGSNTYALGRYHEALIGFSSARKIYSGAHARNTLPPDLFPEFITSFQYLAKIYGVLELQEQALEEYQQALKYLVEDASTTGLSVLPISPNSSENSPVSDPKSRFSEHSKNATAAGLYNAIGLIYNQMGKRNESFQSHMTALNIYLSLKNGNKYSVDYAVTLNYLGALHDDMRDFVQAEAYHLEALQITREISNNDVVLVSSSAYHLGIVCEHTGREEEALGYFLQALEGFRLMHYSADSSVSSPPPNATTTTASTSTSDKEEEGERAGERGERGGTKEPGGAAGVGAALVVAHFDVYTTTHYIARIYERLEQYEKAVEYYQLTHTAQLLVLGDTHPEVAVTSYSLGNVYQTLGKNTEALYYFTRALPVFRETYGESHLVVSSILNSMGALFYADARFDDALRVFSAALDIQILSLGEEHMDVVTTKNNIGHCYFRIGDALHAIDMYYDTHELLVKLVGKDHADTQSAKSAILFLEDRIEVLERIEREEMEGSEGGEGPETEGEGEGEGEVLLVGGHRHNRRPLQDGEGEKKDFGGYGEDELRAQRRVKVKKRLAEVTLEGETSA